MANRVHLGVVFIFAIQAGMGSWIFGGSFRTVALTGMPVPGAADGAVYNVFDRPVLNDIGQTAFYSELSGATIDPNSARAVLSEGPGSLEVIARSGSIAPGATTPFQSFFSEQILINEHGQTAFLGNLGQVGGGNAGGIWLHDGTETQKVVLQYDPGVGVPSDVFFGGVEPSSLNLNSLGQVTFRASLGKVGAGPRDFAALGVWSGDSSALTPVVLIGDVPGTTTGVGVNTIMSNSVGDVLLGSATTLHIARGGAYEQIALRGLQAPDLPAGVEYAFTPLFTPTLNSSGQIALYGRIDGLGVDSTNDFAVWAGDKDQLSLVTREGDVPPGFSSDQVFVGGAVTFGRPIINASGNVVFSAVVSGPGITLGSLWTNRSGNLEKVIIRGDHLPGVDDGLTLLTHGAYTINGSNQIAFRGRLQGPGIGDGNDYGIWAEDADYMLKLVAREGDLFEVAPGDFRTISELDFLGGWGNETGKPTAFNAYGQLAFRATFTDGTEGIFVSNVTAAVPEPRPILLTICAFIFVGFVRWKSLVAVSTSNAHE